MATCPLSFRGAGRSELFAGSLHTASPTSLQELRLQARSFSRSQRGQGWNRPAQRPVNMSSARHTGGISRKMVRAKGKSAYF